MARIKLDICSSHLFEYTLVVRVGDLNYGAHVGNSEMVGILHDARIALLEAMGLTEGDLGDGKTGIVMDDLVVNFRAEAFLGDKLVVGCSFTDVSQAGFRLCYHVMRDGKTVAVAETGLVGYNYNSRSISFLPDVFKQRAERYTLS
ncbi:MAG: thioesterase family protein [Desulfobacterales bacterium]|nr:thioesterase family protein [Desulfobacterales bacterium]